ncbi:MAG: cation:dicarboxylate symporter family transporter, partial [Planctomycetota bacterium]
MRTFLKRWRFTLILICAVAAGALLGYAIGPKAQALRPLGDVFLNLLLTAVVPLVFFSISSAVAASGNLKRLGRIAGCMLVVFVITGVLSSCLMLFTVKAFDPGKGLTLQLDQPPQQDTGSLSEKIVNTFTV